MQREGEVRFSVIVPVYNAARTLSDCVRSVVAQAGAPDWECILIDDGSADNSGKLCDVLAGLCPGVTALHQENAGPSAARNAGLEAARGEWLLFLDSDDLWPAGMLENLRAAQDADPGCDWFVGGNLILQPDGTTAPDPAPPQPGVLDSDDYAERVARVLGGERSAVWRFCVRRALVQRSRVRFWPSIHWGEDLAFSLLLLRRCRYLHFVDFPFTVYRAGRGGALSAGAAAKQLRSLALLLRRMERRLPDLPESERTVILNRLAESFWPQARAAASRDKAVRRACRPAMEACRPLYAYGGQQATGCFSWALFARTLRLFGPRFALWLGGLLKG